MWGRQKASRGGKAPEMNLSLKFDPVHISGKRQAIYVNDDARSQLLQ